MRTEDGRSPSRPQRQRLLLLAASCLPERGSEPGVGWNRALQAAQTFDTWVVCDQVSAPKIDHYLSMHGAVDGLRFEYVRSPDWERGLKRIPGLYYVSYNLWQRRAFRAARALHASVGFDLAHQVTLCGYREPGYAWQLGIPFVWGPIGGTQNYPWHLLAEAGWRGAAHEGVRSLFNSLQLRTSGRVRRAAWQAAALLAASSTNQSDFARVIGRAPERMLETGLPALAATTPTRAHGSPLRILWSGELRAHKALSLFLKALARLPDAVTCEVRILGDGAYTKRWRALARRLGVDRHIQWMGWLSHPEALEQYSWAQLLVFTSLRDTSGNVVLEALGSGIPVVCLDHQGVHDIVTEQSGVRIPVTTSREIADCLAGTIATLAVDRDEWQRLSRGASERAAELLWARQGARMDAIYRRVLEDPSPMSRPLRPGVIERVSDLAKELAQRAASTVSGTLNEVLPRRSGGSIGILTYHRVTPHVAGIATPTYNVRPERFRMQVAGLLERGFTVWPLQRLIDHGRRGLAVPDKTIVITFDDGYECVYRHAWPALADLGACATVFLNTQYLDSERPFPFDPWARRLEACLPDDAYRPLRSEQCTEMQASGVIELGSHTHSHADFRKRPAALRADIEQSLDILRSRFGRSEVTFAFPFGRRSHGFVSDDLIAAAQGAGVLCSLSTDGALVDPTTDPFSWGRFSAYDWDTGATLAAKLEGRYEWVERMRGWAQRARTVGLSKPLDVRAGHS